MLKKLLLILPVLVAACVFFDVGFRTNCGRNNAALATCKQISMLRAVIAYENNQPFSLHNISDGQLEQLHETSKDIWTRPARYYLRTSTHNVPGKEPVAFCDTPFSNVKAHWYTLKQPLHAVAYSDSSTALLTPKQFAAIDQSQFIAIDSINQRTEETAK